MPAFSIASANGLIAIEPCFAGPATDGGDGGRGAGLDGADSFNSAATLSRLASASATWSFGNGLP